MDGQKQTTDAQLSDGTILRFNGQLAPDEVKAKVSAYRARQTGQTSGGMLDDPSVRSTLQYLKEHPDTKVAKPEDSPIAATGQRLLDTVTGLAKTIFTPPETPDKWSAGDWLANSAGPGGVVLKRLGGGVVDAEKQIAPQVKQQWKTAGDSGDPLITALQYARIGTTAASMADPFATGSVANVNELESQGKPKSATAQGLTDAALLGLGAKIPDAAAVAREAFSRDLLSTSHDILNKSANATKGKLWDAHNQVSQQVGKLKNDITAADYQAGGPSIPVADIYAKIIDLADKYKASGRDTPAFSNAVKAVTQRGPTLTWKELADLKQEIGSEWFKSADGTPDSAATNELRATVDKKLSSKAGELGRSKQYEAYNSLWRTLKGYENDGVMGRLLGADNGAKFFDTLRDSANKAELARMTDSLSKFGFDPDTFTDLVKSHAPLHDYTIASKGPLSKARLAIQHPVTAIPGMIAGGVVGSAIPIPGATFLGGTGGAVASVRGAARLSAARAVAKLGKPSLVGEMTEAAKVQPVGSGERPTPPPSMPNVTAPVGGGSTGGSVQQIIQEYMNKQRSPEFGGASSTPKETVKGVDPSEVAEGLRGLGYTKAEAAARAKEAVAANPYDFNAALTHAIRGGPEAKAAAIKNITPNASGESAASQEAINRSTSEKAGKIQRIRIDTRSGQETKLIGPDAVDAKAGPYDVIVKRGPKGEEIQDRGAKARK